ncbi:unnamed protein product [Acanthoscelides obtectus]|uniref:Uncharacterized protein n=1 Tax=Acanthoscelides obtectus TaxID=200917 RepID=A0A9P0Q671_ACAOB|nr:unnamed protein product [Acanthoscelides obtectus]CAK1646575.1 hypothetical protein AOBTE_LOCUS14726 [Acanthoscelides obtectus]
MPISLRAKTAGKQPISDSFMLFLDRSRLSVVFIRKISFFDDSTRLFTPNVNMNERCRPVSRAMQMVLMAKNTPLGDNTVQNTDMDLTIDNHVELGVDTTVSLETSNISDTSRLILENDISALCVMSDEQILEIVDENLQILEEEISNAAEKSNAFEVRKEGDNEQEIESHLNTVENNMEIIAKTTGNPNTITEITVRRRSNVKNSLRDWDQKINQRKREKGVQYKGKKKQPEGWTYDRPRPSRFLADPCHCKRGNKGETKYKCSTIGEERRRKIFDTFWNKMSWPEKKMFVKGFVKIDKVKRRRGTNDISRRNYSMTYTLKNGLEDVMVCKNMFVGTLGLKGRTVVEWVKEHLENIESTEITEGPPINRKSIVKQAKLESSNTGVLQFFGSLAKMESHYCRATSKKVYLEPLWISKASLYKFYKSEYCIENKVQPVSQAKFDTTFKELNLSLFRPKKDECDVCVLQN